MFLTICAMITIAGCGKKPDVAAVDVTPTVEPTELALTATPTAAPAEAVTADVPVTKDPIKGVPVEEDPEPTKAPAEEATTPKATTKPTATPKPADTDNTSQSHPDVSSIYYPIYGYYTNGSSGDDFYYMSIVEIDASGFSFSIHKGESGETVFNTNVARFEKSDSTTAYYRGKKYTLSFDCSENATITVSGFNALGGNNTFWNTDVLQAG